MDRDKMMCMKYEQLYQGICWDYFVIRGAESFSGFKSLSDILEDEVDAEIVNRDEFSGRVLSMLEKMHEDGVIRPKSA